MQAKAIPDVAIYDISTVEIPHEKILEIGQPNGNRGRVICLAHELEKALPDTKPVTMVADRDYDEVLGKFYKYQILFFTDYSCLEMYAFNQDTLGLILLAIVPGFARPASQVLYDLEPALRSLFAIRCTNLKLALDLQWLDCADCLEAKERLHLDDDEFVKRYLSKNGALEKQLQFKEALATIKAALDPDPRLCINGHDFVYLLSWYLRNHSPKQTPFYRVEILEKFVMSYVDVASVHELALFRALLTRLVRP
jgi:hypothetical protein